MWRLFGLVIMCTLGLLLGCRNVEMTETIVQNTLAPQATETATPLLPTATQTPIPRVYLTRQPPTRRPTPSPDPYQKAELAYLEAAIEQTVKTFDGLVSYMIIDLQTGETIGRNAEVALSGMSLVKIPILIETYAALDRDPHSEQLKLITQTTALSSNYSANLLLKTVVSDRTDSYHGAELVTNNLRQLGIFNTFMLVPYDFDAQVGRLATLMTPANQRLDVTTEPDIYRQTTMADLAALLTMLYDCAENDAGALRVFYEDRLNSAECQAIITVLQLNDLVSLLEGGLPDGATFAHKIGYVDETYGDVGIVYSPRGDYVIALALYSKGWLQWEIGSPIFREISRLAYVHFNEGYSAEILAAPPALTPSPTAPPQPDLPRAIVYGTAGIGLKLRQTPNGTKLTILPDGTVVLLLSTPPQDLNGVTWRNIQTIDGQTGWVGADYLNTE